MKTKTLILISLIAPVILLSVVAYALSPSLNTADTYGVLSSTYTDTSAGTTLTGDLGYTTPPATPPTVVGVTHIADGAYNQAGIDQGTALATSNALPCDFNFIGATDLSLLVQPLPVGVYCTTGAQSVGVGGITLLSGTYVFRSTGALNTVANSIVSGGDACDVFWTPVATTLGANSTFRGTVIDDAGITVGSMVTWLGRALAFGGTITTDTDTITVPTCAVPPPVIPPVIPPPIIPPPIVPPPAVPPTPPIVVPDSHSTGSSGNIPTSVITPVFVPPPQPYCIANPLQCKG